MTKPNCRACSFSVWLVHPQVCCKHPQRDELQFAILGFSQDNRWPDSFDPAALSMCSGYETDVESNADIVASLQELVEQLRIQIRGTLRERDAATMELSELQTAALDVLKIAYIGGGRGICPKAFVEPLRRLSKSVSKADPQSPCQPAEDPEPSRCEWHCGETDKRCILPRGHAGGETGTHQF